MPAAAHRQSTSWGAPKLHHWSSVAHQDQSSSSPLAQVRVNLGGFTPFRVGNWADGTSPSPLDKPWGGGATERGKPRNRCQSELWLHGC